MNFNIEPEYFDKPGLKHVRWVIVLLITLTVLACVSGCTAETKEVTHQYSIPSGLKDCMFYQMQSSTGRGLTVVRCPNSVTTVHKGGKGPWTTITIDGVQYELTEKKKE